MTSKKNLSRILAFIAAPSLAIVDLFVVNLVNNGKRLVKFGNPGKASAVQIEKVYGRWITVSMNRKGKRCDLSVKDAKGKLFYSQANLPCEMGAGRLDEDGKNKIVINARASSYSGSDRASFISISEVSWTRAN